jgi:transketolase
MADISPALSEKKSYEHSIESLKVVAGAVRKLSIDAIEAAQSGHPGLPLGCAEIGAALYGHFLNHYPQDPNWPARDRMILSAGHGSMWLYSLLHLSGFDLSLEEIKRFRQMNSKTPGHPERGHTAGVETTTGPLGQGLAHGVGQAMGLKKAIATFHLPKDLFNSKVVALAGDGCMMEGISHEACALAGHLNLDNLIVIYDANHVCLDGPLSECASEDTAMRFRAYGWHVVTINGQSLEEVLSTLDSVRLNQDKPVLIMAHTTIGFGSPAKAGSHEAHGAPLGASEAKQTLEGLGLSLNPFEVDVRAYDYFKNRLKEQGESYKIWQAKWNEWRKANVEEAKAYDTALESAVSFEVEASLKALAAKSSLATRSSSSEALNFLAGKLPWMLGGSADLSCSDNTFIKGAPALSRDNWNGRNVKYGVREFAMAAIACGISQTGWWKPFVGTFLTFSDYMKNAIRLSALMQLPVIYQFTHDSVFLGEDGPTHQPIEHVAGLRSVPGLYVIRPADVYEARAAWIWALRSQKPTALILSRQALPTLEQAIRPLEEGIARGAYVIHEPKKLDWVAIATGSEVSLALDLAKSCQEKGVGVRVVSMPCTELFDQQPSSYRSQVLGEIGTKRLSLEAGSTFGWHKYVGEMGLVIGIDHYGYSSPAKEIYKAVGFTVESIMKQMSL